MQKKITIFNKAIKYWLPPLFWATVIFTFSSLPTVETTKFFLGDFLLKKTAHIIEYGILATLVYRGLINSQVNLKKAMCLAVITALIYGISDEFHQSFTPGRGPTIRDVFIDTLGATIFIYGIIGNIKRFPSKFQDIYLKYQITQA